ncbi:MAG: PAS domain S-box protein, partial [Hydrogenophaga sp.]|uniref:PAS domain S-box protein n=1 Tax=Hydrogenophaga sp. TaxID=1904254 RepID=UPI00168EE30E
MTTANAPCAPWSALPGPVLLLATDGTVRHASAACEAWLGPTAPHEDWLQGIDEPQRSALREYLGAAEAFELSLSRRHPNSPQGRPRHLRLNARWLPDVDAWLCVLVDLDSHHEQCTEAREETAFLRAFADAVPVMMSFYDRDRMLRYANRHYIRQYGLDPERMIGLHVSEVLGEANTPDTPFEDRAARFSSNDQGTRTSFTRKVERHDGSLQWIDITLASIHADGLRHVGWGSLTQDITQKHEAQDALRESEERLQKFLNANAEGLVFHAQGVIVDVNPSACALLGSDMRELLGTSLLDRVQPVDRSVAAAVLLGAEDSSTEASLLQPGGVSLPVEFIGRTIWRESQRLRAVVIRDIRDRRQAQARIHTLIE